MTATKNNICILLLFLSINVSAQIPIPDSCLLSPNAASLGQYGEVPVSLYTGTVQINVPICEIDYMGQKRVNESMIVAYDRF